MATQNDLFCGGCQPQSSAALENSHIFRTVGNLYYGSDGRNTDGANGYFIWIFDSATVPANGNMSTFTAQQIVRHVVNVGPSTGSGTGNWAHGGYGNGELFLFGCTIVISTTDLPVLTIAASNLNFIECDTILEYGQYF